MALEVFLDSTKILLAGGLDMLSLQVLKIRVLEHSGLKPTPATFHFTLF
jgi:hypothetical protein